jgi:drug/metabolite transporter (DMT)-like permease
VSELGPPRRVRVTSPRTRATRPSAWVAATREIDEQTSIGQVYMRSLIRSQLRLALMVCAVFGVLLGGLPLLLILAPGLSTLRVLGLPLPWVLLGGLVYPVLIVGGWLYVRAAERTEANFVELVKQQ